MVSVRCCRKAPREKFMILQVVRRVKRPTLASAGAASRIGKAGPHSIPRFQTKVGLEIGPFPQGKLVNRENRANNH